MKKTGFLHDDRYLLHDTGPHHPERPERLKAIYKGIKEGGLLPMLTGISYNFHKMALSTASESSQFWSSMASAVIFGLAFATVLTLGFVPTLYSLLFRVRYKGFTW